MGQNIQSTSTLPKFFSNFFYLLVWEREKHPCGAKLIYAFIDRFLHVSLLGIKPAPLVYQEYILRNWATLPGPHPTNFNEWNGVAFVELTIQTKVNNEKFQKQIITRISPLITTHAYQAPNKKVVSMQESSISLPFKLSHIILQVTTDLATLQTPCCVTPPLFAHAVLSTWNSLSALCLVKFSRKPSEFALLSSSKPMLPPGLDQGPSFGLPR